MGTQKNRLDETPKHMFSLIGKKIIKILRNLDLCKCVTLVRPIQIRAKTTCSFLKLRTTDWYSPIVGFKPHQDCIFEN